MNLLELSQTIRKVRIAQGMTVEQLAKKSSFSKGFISQVENFRQTPSLKALVRIAEALGLPVSRLFSENGENHGIRYLALAYQQIGRKMDPFLIEYTPGAPRDFMFHDTEEFFLLLEGRLNYYLYDNSGLHEMKAGDTLYMKANIPHRVQLPDGCTFAKGLVIYTDPALPVQ